MKFAPDTYESPQAAKQRLLHMNISALVGYVITQIGISSARWLGIISISWFLILILTVIVNTVTIGFIVYLARKKGIGSKEENVIFLFELALFSSLSAVGFYALGSMSYVGLVFLLIALIVELPYCTFPEACMIAGVSVCSYLSVSLLNRSPGRDILFSGAYYAAAFLPAYVLLLHVSRQINGQRARINHDRHELEQMNARLKSSNVRLRRAQELTLKELDLASAVQHAFLPATPESLKDWEIALSFRPCFGVSGDFYDFYYRGETLKGLSIYDVSGHGVSSALLTMIVKPAMADTFFKMESHPLDRIMSSINKTLASLFCDIDHFLTAIILRFDGDRVEYANAGHPDLILRKADGTTTLVGRDVDHFKGEPLGIDCREKPYHFEEFTVTRGDMILLYTDCILEAESVNGEHYGEARLIDSFLRAPDSAQEALDFVLAEFNAFTRIEDVMDDLTVIVLRKK